MKKSYKCEKLEHTIHFLPDKIKFCSSCTEGLGIQVNGFSKIDKNEILKIQEKYVKQLKDGIIPQQCIGCGEIKEQKKENKSFLQKFFPQRKKRWVSHVVVNHFKQCECNCVYCAQKILYPNITQNYELLPIIRELYKQKIFSTNNLHVEFQGGNVSMLKEFEALICEFEKIGTSHYSFLINGVQYIPAIENIQKKKCTICISIDSGTRETFHKIKNIDAFEKTIENINKFKKNQNIELIIKYILIHEYNDNKNEIEKFITLISKMDNISAVLFEIDFRDLFMFGNRNISNIEKYKELLNYAEQLCKKMSVNFIISSTSQPFLCTEP